MSPYHLKLPLNKIQSSHNDGESLRIEDSPQQEHLQVVK